ncbi:MAG: orotate phosphoribosyltransferase [Candidatus Aureabacteria bacterium]|nr:orotate phosphoribosyltransferase [Candidatus Auribacterota bacterium]
MDSLSELKQELLNHALKFGDFTLASGQKSSYYINCKPVTLSAKGSYLVGENLLELIPEDCIAVGGLTLGADPIVSSITLVSHLKKRPIQGFLVRKEKKDHGTTSQMENPPPEGSLVTIVDDVITTGGSALKATEIALASGLKVAVVLCIVDRSQGGKEAFEKLGIPMRSLFKIQDFLPPDKKGN